MVIKTLMKQIKQYKKDSWLTILFVIVEVILEIMIPLLMARIIDLGIEAGDINAVYKYGFIMFIIV